MAGRPPKPVAVIDNKKSRRTLAELEAREKAEPKYDKKDFEPPSEMVDTVAIEHWHELTAIWRDMKNCPVCDADRRAIQIACEAWAEKTLCDKEIRKKPDPIVIVPTGNIDKDGNKKFAQIKNPYYDRRDKARAIYLQYAKELQLTPISRARIGKAAVNNDSEEDADFFN